MNHLLRQKVTHRFRHRVSKYSWQSLQSKFNQSNFFINEAKSSLEKKSCVAQLEAYRETQAYAIKVEVIPWVIQGFFGCLLSPSSFKCQQREISRRMKGGEGNLSCISFLFPGDLSLLCLSFSSVTFPEKSAGRRQRSLYLKLLFCSFKEGCLCEKIFSFPSPSLKHPARVFPTHLIFTSK